MGQFPMKTAYIHLCPPLPAQAVLVHLIHYIHYYINHIKWHIKR